MKVSNMTSSRGNDVPNQFIITDAVTDNGGNIGHFRSVFQSYSSVIVAINHDGTTFLDTDKWDYSVTTSKYRNQFLGETKKETQAKIDSGEYILTNLN